MSAFTFAATANLTLLYHPILPNQAERQLFDRFFGFGYDEPFRLYEACTLGSVGFECNAFLPCLKVCNCVSNRVRLAERLASHVSNPPSRPPFLYRPQSS